MLIEEYKEVFKTDPPKHLTRDGQVWCSACGKNPAQIKPILGAQALMVCDECQKIQKPANFNPLTPEEKMDGLSPEEVMSGAHAGMPNQFGNNSKKGWHEEHGEEVNKALEALS